MEQKPVLETVPGQLAGDLLEGADAIAEFLFGSREHRSKVYYLRRRSRLPLFRLGSVLCARKSILMKHIHGQEEAFFERFRESESPIPTAGGKDD